MRHNSTAPVLIAALVLCAGACKAQKPEHDAAKVRSEPEPEPEAEPEPEDGHPSGGLDKLVRGAAPTLPEPLVGLRARQSRAEVRELAPTLRGAGDEPRFAELEDPRTPGVSFRLRFDLPGDEGRLINVTAELERRPALELATHRWGPPITVTDGNGRTSFFWFDPEAKLRASLSPTNAGKLNLEFMPYETATALLGDAHVALGSGAMLGLTRAEVEAKYGDHLRRIAEPEPGTWVAQLWYPASEWNPQPTLVRLESGGERVERVVLELPFLYLPKLRAALFSELEGLFGPLVRGDAETGGRFEVGGKVAIDLGIERGRWILEATSLAPK